MLLFFLNLLLETSKTDSELSEPLCKCVSESSVLHYMKYVFKILELEQSNFISRKWLALRAFQLNRMYLGLRDLNEALTFIDYF